MSILSDQYQSLTRAQREYVLNMLFNKIYQNPSAYGLSEDGILRIGDKLDFTSLFEDKDEILSIFDKATQTVTEGSVQEKLILENNGKISAWVKSHPGEPLNESKVSEILTARSEPELKKPEESEEPKGPEQPKTDTVQIEEDIEKAKQRLAQLEGEPKTATGAALSGKEAEYVEKRDEQEMEREFAKARGDLEEVKAGQERNPNLVRSMEQDTKKLIREKANIATDPVEMALREDVNKIFTEGLFLKTPGIRSKKWKFIRNLPFSKLVKYYREDSNNSGLPPEAVSELKRSDKYKQFVDHVLQLKDETEGAVIALDENASIETATRKIGEFLLRMANVKAKLAA